MATVHNSSLELFDFCKNQDKARHIKYPKVTEGTYMKNMELVSKLLKAKITAQLRSKFALFFDGLSEVEASYFDTFATCPADNSFGYE